MYSWFRGGVVAEGRSGGRDTRRIFRFVEWLPLLHFILFWNDVVDRLFHHLILVNNFIMPIVESNKYPKKSRTPPHLTPPPIIRINLNKKTQNKKIIKYP